LNTEHLSTRRVAHTRHRAARRAASRGWPVFPVHRHSKAPAVRDWERRATCDLGQIDRWWADTAYNVGIACGPAGLVVLDLDTGTREAAPEHWARLGVACGADVFAILSARAGHPYPIHTYTVRTPHHGSHLYFQAPLDQALRNTAGTLGWRVDTRAAGGFVLAAGSTLLVAGQPTRYHLVRDVPPLSLPAWLSAALSPPRPSQPAAPSAPRQVNAYVQAAIRGETDAVTKARLGTRNTTLFRAAANLGRLVGTGLVDESTVTDSLAAAAHVHIGVDGFTDAEARRAIANGLVRGRGTTAG
jgi:Bifunctional DNA primase/polymerase, N-terminal